MNCCFYTAIDQLPLATVAAIEFVPVIALAALGARTPRNVAALALAVPGVYVLTGVHLAGEATGMAFAFANALLFAATSCCADRGRQAGARHRRPGGGDGPGRGLRHADRRRATAGARDPIAILAGIGVGISSSVIPYVCDQLALARLPRATYA